MAHGCSDRVNNRCLGGVLCCGPAAQQHHRWYGYLHGLPVAARGRRQAQHPELDACLAHPLDGEHDVRLAGRAVALVNHQARDAPRGTDACTSQPELACTSFMSPASKLNCVLCVTMVSVLAQEGDAEPRWLHPGAETMLIRTRGRD